MGRQLIVATALCGLLLLGGAAWSGNTTVGAPAVAGPRLVRMLDTLEISPAQKREVAGILKANREAIRTLRASVTSAFLTLRETMAKTPGDEAAVRAGARAAAEAATELAVARGRVKAAIDAVLSPQQRVRRDALRQKLREKVEARRLDRQGELDAWIEGNLS